MSKLKKIVSQFFVFFCIFTGKMMQKWRCMCNHFCDLWESQKMILNSHPKSEEGKNGSYVLTLIKLIDHDLIWRDEKLHSSIIQDKKAVLERSESRKKLDRKTADIFTDFFSFSQWIIQLTFVLKKLHSVWKWSKMSHVIFLLKKG